jgi:hypothetical protein
VSKQVQEHGAQSELLCNAVNELVNGKSSLSAHDVKYLKRDSMSNSRGSANDQ